MHNLISAIGQNRLDSYNLVINIYRDSTVTTRRYNVIDI
jgi:hypothetical protein